MEALRIYGADGSVIIDVKVDDSSYRNRDIMGDDTITLYYSLPEHVEIPVGSYCEFQNQRYTLMRPEAFKKKHSRYFEYTVTMESDIAKAKMWKFRNTVDGRLKFSYTAQPHEHLEMFIDNMNRRDSEPTWYYDRDAGDCIEGVETLINYDHAFCYDALGQMADTFETEFEIAFERQSDGSMRKHVKLKKLEYNKTYPLELSYGKGKGFLPDVGRSNYGDNPPVEILYTQGGTDNIDRSKYGNSELLLPKSVGGVMKTLQYDGEHFEKEEGFDEENARTYVTDDLGYSIRRADKDLSSLAEDSLDCSSIYPKRVGTISAVQETDASKNFWDFWDDADDVPNYEDYLIEGETMTVIFQSGELAGREFDVKYTHDAKNGYARHHFEIVPKEEDGETMPNLIFSPAVGDTYAVFHCYLPDEYIADDTEKTGAEWEMFRAAVKYMYENEEQLFTFTGEVDQIWAKANWLNVGGMFVLGGYVNFTDEHFQEEPALVRITGIKDYINSPYRLELTLSNGIVTAGFSTTMVQLQSEGVAVGDSYRNSVDYTKRRWRDTQETMTMLEQAFTNFSESISPVTVQTMQLIAGDESLQFQFVRSLTDHTKVADTIVYDNNAKQLTVGGGVNNSYLQHLTIGIDYISSEIDDGDHPVWELDPYTSAILEDGTKSYYLYARCRRGNQRTGVFILSQTPFEMDADNAYYYFLVGILNSEYEDERSFVTLYGYTEILPGRITTERIVSGDGESYFDMANDAMKLGDALDFNSKGDGTLRLKGTIVQSQSGAENYLGCFRGAWDATTTYFQGDEVTYSSNDITSTYRYINSTPSSGHAPDDADAYGYWQVISQGGQGNKGDTGDTGNFTELRYAVNGSTTAGPTIKDKTALVPEWEDDEGNTGEWSTTYPAVPSGSYLWMISAMKRGDGTALVTEWDGPVRITPYNGTNGSSPVLVYRGEYDSNKVYYGTSDRRDAVHYDNAYYVARTDAGDFINILPTDTSKWNQFGASFESIATGLLLAEGASIGDWYISEGRIVSTLQNTGNRIILDAGKETELNPSGIPRIQMHSETTGSTITLDAEEGSVEAMSDTESGTGASLAASGIFANRAEQPCEESSSGHTRMGAIVGRGNGKVDEGTTSEDNFVAGVYGDAENSGTAPSFGGFFKNLKACGLVMNCTTVEESSVTLTDTSSLVVGLLDSQCSVTLPAATRIGQTIFFFQMGAGDMIIYPSGDDRIYDGHSQVTEGFDVWEGYEAVAHFVRVKISGETYGCWLLSRFSH